MTDPITKLYEAQIKIPVPQRRGLLGEVYAQSQDLLHASAKELLEALAYAPEVGAVMSDIGGELDQIDLPAGDAVLLIQLKGQPWTYVVGVGDAANSVSLEDWSEFTGKKALRVTHYKSEGNLTYTLYDNGDEEESFSSDGRMFLALAEDPSAEVVQEYLNRRESGTSYETERWDLDSFDWSDYATEFHFLHETLVDLDAYLTFFSARYDDSKKCIELTSGDRTNLDYVERVDVVLCRASRWQIRDAAVKKHPPTMALVNAISENNLTKAVDAISQGADVDACRPGSTSCLLCHADLPIAEALLKAGAAPNGSQGATSPLMNVAISSKERSLRKARLLIDAGADPDLGYTLPPGEMVGRSEPYRPLHNAVTRGAYDMVCLLLKAGADPNATNGAGQDALAQGQSTIDFWKKDQPTYLLEVRKSMELLRQYICGELAAQDIPWPSALT